MALADGLTHYWSLDEAASTDNAVDAAGSFTLDRISTPGVDSGKVGGCRTFDGLKAFYRNSVSDLQPGDTSFTWQAWVYLFNNAALRMVLGKWAGTANGLASDDYEYLLYYDNGANRLKWQVSPDGTGPSTVTVTANNFGAPSTSVWYLLHGWHDSVNNEIGIAVNAGTPNTQAHSTGVFSGTPRENFSMGAFEALSNGYWVGSLDEVGLWTRVLTAPERSQLYNGGSGMSHAAILASGGGGGGGARRRINAFLFGV